MCSEDTPNKFPGRQKRLFEFVKDHPLQTLLKGGEQVVDVTEVVAKRQKLNEDQYKAAREVEGLVYVKKGSRDKFGNMREKQGGRPRKAQSELAGVLGGKSSNRKKIGDDRH